MPVRLISIFASRPASDEYTRLNGKYDGNFRIYQANVEFKGVVPYTDITAGRIYLNNLDMYKIDDIRIANIGICWEHKS